MVKESIIAEHVRMIRAIWSPTKDLTYADESHISHRYEAIPPDNCRYTVFKILRTRMSEVR